MYKRQIYSLAIHYREILEPVVLKRWGVESMTGLNAEGQAAQEALLERLGRLAKLADRDASRRERNLATASA